MKRSDVEKMLLMMGCNPKLLGYNAIVSAVMIIDENPNVSMKEIYVQVSAEQGKAWSAGERNIRSAISLMRMNMKYHDLVCKYFGEEGSNSKALFRFHSMLKLELEEGGK